MKIFPRHARNFLITILAITTIPACSLIPGKNDNPEPSKEVLPSPTPTQINLGGIEQNPCEGLSGTLETQILVGPADAVGLEPVAIGNVPFTVVKEGEIYLVQGGGNLTYQDVLTEAWGTYSVSLVMDTTISGTCNHQAEEGTLNLKMNATGEQMVEVRAEGFQGDYPWEGDRELELAFPIAEGAQVEGEGWILILHLDTEPAP